MIETPRLRLRAWRDDDRDWHAAQCACPIAMAYLGGPKTRAECDVRIDRMMTAHAAGEPAFWLVERRSDGLRIGDVGLKRVDAPGASMQGEIEIGWRLAREAWGHGYAREAAEAALDIAFAGGADRVVALTSPRNTASRGLVARLGMREQPDLAFADPRFGPEDTPTLVYLIGTGDMRHR